MPWLIVAGCLIWAIFGSPKKDIANWFWSETPAPWESVDAFYYPDINNLTVDVRAYGLESLEDCRAWVLQQARAHGDPSLKSGDYECGVGYLEDFGSIRVYRISAE